MTYARVDEFFVKIENLQLLPRGRIIVRGSRVYSGFRNILADQRLQ